MTYTPRHAYDIAALNDAIIHRCPEKEDDGITPCCGKTVFELPHFDRITVNDSIVNCHELEEV